MTDFDSHNQNALKSISLAKNKVFEPLGLLISDLILEPESQEYSALSFSINGSKFKFRSSKITPTKIGQFVTCWKRNSAGITEPFDVSDDFDFLIVQATDGTRFGQFVFPKTVLVEKKIITNLESEGKRGFRVYPRWDKTDNAQAQRTQKWQLMYFFEIPENNTQGLERAKSLYQGT